jgi:two-component system, cell cycle response regulator
MGTSLAQSHPHGADLKARQLPLGLETPGHLADSTTGAARHLLARRSVLDDTLSRGPAAGATLLLRCPPIPAALLLLSRKQTRERFRNLLQMASLEIDLASSAIDAIERLASRVHALLFTDDLEVIRSARQLPSGIATHIVFVGASGELPESEALRAGANDCMPSNARGEHFWAHLTIARRIADLAASLQLALRDNRMLSTVDELTRAGRRGFFEEHFPREVERAVRFCRPLALVMCDIDHFKQVNDRYGHQVGDAVLREFTLRVSGNLRVGKDWVARLGGEEFAVVFPDTTARDASVAASRLRERIASPSFDILPRPIAVTASFGVCALEDFGPVSAQGLAARMMREADAALYRSKHHGRDRVSACTVSCDEVSSSKIASSDAPHAGFA